MSAKAVKERPIIFSAPMVRAILEGRKTQTRRVVKDADDWTHVDRVIDEQTGLPFFRFSYSEPGVVQSEVVECPHGTVGERMWVRESYFDEVVTENGKQFRNVAHRATNVFGDGGIKWKSPRFMPRWASRLTLEITNVRVERLATITPQDAACEIGAEWARGAYRLVGGDKVNPLDHFANLWDEIHGKKHPWSSNPWVWVIEFKPLAS